jgi:hypothetical protein
VIYKKGKRDSCRDLFKSGNILTLPSAYIFECLLHTFSQIRNGGIQRSGTAHGRALRYKDNLCLEHCKTKQAQDFVAFRGRKLYNSLPVNLRKCEDLRIFRRILKNFLLEQPLYSIDEFVTHCDQYSELVD